MGMASVLLAKPRSYSEVINDLDDEVVGLFQVLRDPAAAKDLENMLRLTPFARVEFLGAYRAGQRPDRAEPAIPGPQLHGVRQCSGHIHLPHRLSGQQQPGAARRRRTTGCATRTCCPCLPSA